MKSQVAVAFVWLMWSGLDMRAQTGVDLSRQARDVDFGNASSTRPSQTGTLLPASCSPGQTYFLTNALAGSNSYGCSSPNTWTLQGGGSGTGATTISQLLDFGVGRTGAQQLTIGGACSSASPCLMRIGSTVLPFTGAIVTLTAGTGTALIYLDSTGTMTVGNNLSLTCNSGCRQVSGVTAFPPESTPVFSWTATGGTWDNAGADDRALLSQKVVTAGPGVIISDSGNVSQISLDTMALLTTAGNNSFTGINTFANAQETAPAQIGTGLPATCTVGDVFFQTNAFPGQNLYFCTLANTWTQMSGAGSGGGGGGGGQVPSLAGSNSFTGPNSFADASETAPAQVGTALPSTCTTGDFFFQSTAMPGQNLYLCTNSNAWTQVSGGGGGGGGAATPAYADLADSPSIAGGSAQTLKSHVLSGGSWTTNNQFGHIHAWGIAAMAGSYFLLSFGSTYIASPPSANSGNLPIDIDCMIGRTAAAAEKSVCAVIFGQNVATYNFQTTPAEILANNVTISVVGVNGAGNPGDITARGLTIVPANF